MGDIFDSPWKILIIAVVIIVLFGSRKLPEAARSLGKSMRILKTEVQGMHEDEVAPTTASTTSVPAAQAQPELAATAQQPVETQAQIEALQKQLNELKTKQS
jgi:sec-independent protein translocase protein TatA